MDSNVPDSAQIVLIAAVASGQGKTTVTAALARALVRRGRRVRVFKCGPDFIDPMLLERAGGAPVGSLDLWMVGEAQCRRQLAQAAREADVILIEGVMGLYDGNPCAADLARTFGLPVLAVIDAGAMAQTAGAVVMGLRDYGPVELAGVIANRIASPAHAAMVAASLRDVPLFATLPKQQTPLPERHLGLVLPDEVRELDSLLDLLAEQLAFDEAAWAQLRSTSVEEVEAELPPPLLAGRSIAIARDAAFCFLYPANLATLRLLGAELRFFSPLADTLSDQAATAWPMAALLPGSVVMHKRLAGLGSQGLDTPHGILRGHTFHYSTLDTPLEPWARTVKHPSGLPGEAVYRQGSLCASYFHAYFASCPEAVAALLGGSAP